MTATDSLSVRVIADLVRDLAITPEQAAGIVGNGIAESGLRAVQEARPTSGRGGWGYWQWTGPRRVAFERWCAAKGLASTSYEANVGYLVVELTGPENKTLRQLKLTKTAKAAAETFEHFFERSRDGRANWPARVKYAEHALALYRASIGTTPTPEKPMSALPEGYFKSPAFWGAAVSVGLKVAAAAGVAVNPALGPVLTQVLPFAASLIGDAIGFYGHVSLARKAKAEGAAEAPVVDAGPAHVGLDEILEALPRIEGDLKAEAEKFDRVRDFVRKLFPEAPKALPAPQAA